MHNFTFEKLPDEPIVLMTALETWKTLEDVPKVEDEFRKVFNALDHQVFYITDFTRAQINFEELLVGSSQVARGEDPILHHPRIKAYLLVTHDPMIASAGEGLSTEAFGNVCFSVA